MSLPILPKEWATLANYSSGPDTGGATKTDPASYTNGFIRGQAAAAQHVNYLLNQYARAARDSIKAFCSVPVFCGSSSENANSLAAISGPYVVSSGMAILTIKAGSGDSVRHGAGGLPISAGTVASITSLVTGAARNLTRIVAIGTGGNNCCYSDDEGATWTAGAALSAVPIAIVYNPTHSRFMVGRSTTTVRYGTNGTAWSSGTLSLDSGGCGLAVLANGNTIACGLDNGDGNDPAFSVSTDGGSTWADTGGTVPTPNSYSEAGWVVGYGGNSTSVWHVGRIGQRTVVCQSSNGAAWSAVLDVALPIGVTSSGVPRILCCQNSGMLVAIHPTSSGLSAVYVSNDGGSTWTNATMWPSTTLNAFGVAGGRIFCASAVNLFGTVGADF